MIFERKVNYYETDAMKIVHHSNYIRFLEEARIDVMERIGIPYSKMEEEGIIIPVLGVNCSYKTPARFDDILQIDVRIKEYTGVKLIMAYTIKNKKTEDIVVTAETKHCFTSENLKPISLKKANLQMHEIMLQAMQF